MLICGVRRDADALGGRLGGDNHRRGLATAGKSRSFASKSPTDSLRRGIRIARTLHSRDRLAYVMTGLVRDMTPYAYLFRWMGSTAHLYQIGSRWYDPQMGWGTQMDPGFAGR